MKKEKLKKAYDELFETFETQIRSLNEKLENCYVERRDKDMELTKLSKYVEELRTEIARLRTQKEDFKAQIEKRDEIIARLNNELSEISEPESEEELNRGLRGIGLYVSDEGKVYDYHRVKELVEENERLKEQLTENTQMKLAGYTAWNVKEVPEIEAENTRLKANLKIARTEIEKRDIEIKRLNEQFNELETRYERSKCNTISIAEHNDRLKEAQRASAYGRDEICRLSAKLAEYEKANTIESAVEKASGVVNSAMNYQLVKKLRDRLQKRSLFIQQLQEQLEARGRQIEELKALNGNAARELDNVKSGNCELTEYAAERLKQIERLGSDLARAIEANDGKQRLLAEKDRVIAELEKSLKESEGAYHVLLTNDYKNLHEEVKRLRSDLTEATQLKDFYEKSWHEVKAELEKSWKDRPRFKLF